MEQQYVIKIKRGRNKYYSDAVGLWNDIFHARFFSESERENFRPPLGSVWVSISRKRVRRLLAMRLADKLTSKPVKFSSFFHEGVINE